MNKKRHIRTLTQIPVGRVYRRAQLAAFSPSIDRDIGQLIKEKKLYRVASGLYYKPKKSRFGTLPPSTEQLIKTFLGGHCFLLFSRNDYNALGLGLTQLYNQTMVYNQKRHGLFTLNNHVFDFRRPHKGFPKKLTKEFLLVDLVNHLDELSEETEHIKLAIRNKLNNFDTKYLSYLARSYGKIATTKFFMEELK